MWSVLAISVAVLEFCQCPKKLGKSGDSDNWLSVIFICFLDIQGCVDHYENCPQWARSGVCTEEPQFMTFLCRESCGTCGFKSRRFFG